MSWPGLPDKKLLLAIDDARWYDLHRHLRRDFQVFHAPSGMQALAQLAARPDLWGIVADLKLPGVDGLQLHDVLSEAAPHLARKMVLLADPLDMHVPWRRRVPCPVLPCPVTHRELTRLLAPEVVPRPDPMRGVGFMLGR